jgi:hypothetical protein
MRFQVLKAVSMKMAAFLDVALCRFTEMLALVINFHLKHCYIKKNRIINVQTLQMLKTFRSSLSNGGNKLMKRKSKMCTT